MAEERGAYDAHDDDRQAGEGIERIGDLLGRFIDERGWPLPSGKTRANGSHPCDKSNLSHGHA